MNKAVFLDRDGTINIEREYLFKIEDFEYISGVVLALRMLQDAGYQLVILTNQSGIARGYYSIEDYEKLTKWMIQDLKNQGVHIAKTYFCPHLPNGTVREYCIDCNCRKPKLGMFEQAVRDLDIDLAHSIAIGDKLRDLEICRNSTTKGYLLGDFTTLQENERDVWANFEHKIMFAKDLLEAAKFIVAN